MEPYEEAKNFEDLSSLIDWNPNVMQNADCRKLYLTRAAWSSECCLWNQFDSTFSVKAVYFLIVAILLLDCL